MKFKRIRKKLTLLTGEKLLKKAVLVSLGFIFKTINPVSRLQETGFMNNV